MRTIAYCAETHKPPTHSTTTTLYDIFAALQDVMDEDSAIVTIMQRLLQGGYIRRIDPQDEAEPCQP